MLFRTSGKSKKISSALPEELCRQFSLAEIKIATNNFDDKLLIGKGGGFSKMYKGFIDDCNCTINVAIKRASSEEGFNESRNEVLSLCQLHHTNLVPLIGYCFDEQEMILVYEFMVNGSLLTHLHNPGNNPLPWKLRLQICIGVACALHYLHSGVKHTIIHRDVKTWNILLDEKWEAKLADLGLSKKGPPSLSKALIRVESNRLAGTFGYLAPEYAQYGELTDKSDVYSFGVVLLEVISARKVLENKLGVEEHQYLVSWALKCVEEGTINEMIDPYLMGKIAPECFKIYMDIATSCVRKEGMDRPMMGEVEVGLEHALQLQESADAARKDVDPGGDQHNYPIDEYTSSASLLEPHESILDLDRI